MNNLLQKPQTIPASLLVPLPTVLVPHILLAAVVTFGEGHLDEEWCEQFVTSAITCCKCGELIVRVQEFHRVEDQFCGYRIERGHRDGSWWFA